MFIQGGGDSDTQEYSEELSQFLKGKDSKNSINSVDQGTRYLACSVS